MREDFEIDQAPLPATVVATAKASFPSRLEIELIQYLFAGPLADIKAARPARALRELRLHLIPMLARLLGVGNEHFLGSLFRELFGPVPTPGNGDGGARLDVRARDLRERRTRSDGGERI